MRIIYVVCVQILAYKIIGILEAVLSSFLCLQNIAKSKIFLASFPQEHDVRQPVSVH